MLGIYGGKGAASQTEWEKFSQVGERVELSARRSMPTIAAHEREVLIILSEL